jgi:hypothetical protein
MYGLMRGCWEGKAAPAAYSTSSYDIHEIHFASYHSNKK